MILIPADFEKQQSRTFDYKGMALFVFSMLLFFLGLLFVQEGRIPVFSLIPIILLSLAGLWLFFRTERKAENPLLNVSLFRIHEFSYGLAAAYLIFIAMNATTLFVPFYLQSLKQFTPMKAGLIISAFPIGMAVFSPLSGYLSDRFSYRPLTVAGVAIMTGAFIVFTTINETTSIAEVVILMVLLGAGSGIFMSPNSSSIMGCVPRDQLGVAGGDQRPGPECGYGLRDDVLRADFFLCIENQHQRPGQRLQRPRLHPRPLGDFHLQRRLHVRVPAHQPHAGRAHRKT